MSRRKIEGKVTPEAAQLIMLDEIAGLLHDQLERMMEAEAEGLVDQIQLPVTPAIYELVVSPPWYSFSLINDDPIIGGNPVFIDVNRDMNARTFRTPVNPQQTLIVNFDKPIIRTIYLATQPPVALVNVRIFGSR